MLLPGPADGLLDMDQRIFVSDLPLLEQPFDPAVLGRPFPESRIDGGKTDHFDDHHILAVPLHGLLGLHGIAVDIGRLHRAHLVADVELRKHDQIGIRLTAEIVGSLRLEQIHVDGSHLLAVHELSDQILIPGQPRRDVRSGRSRKGLLLKSFSVVVPREHLDGGDQRRNKHLVSHLETEGLRMLKGLLHPRKTGRRDGPRCSALAYALPQKNSATHASTKETVSFLITERIRVHPGSCDVIITKRKCGVVRLSDGRLW